MKLKKYLTILAIFISSNTINAQEQQYFPDPDTLVQKNLEAWQDMKFGLLMHWGAYSQWGIVESWSICPEDLSWASGARKPGVADNYNEYVKKYEALPTTFNPTKFNPSKWADAAKEAGMKYLVFTTKHHDGFCMFDTKQTNYKITDASCPFAADPKSNIAKEVFNAFRRDSFFIGAYFSKPDWHSDYYWWKQFPAVDRNCNYAIQKHPEQWKKFVDYTHNQINELMSDYGKLDILWLDGGWVRPTTDDEIKNTLAEIYENSRLDIRREDDFIFLHEKTRGLQADDHILPRDHFRLTTTNARTMTHAPHLDFPAGKILWHFEFHFRNAGFIGFEHGFPKRGIGKVRANGWLHVACSCRRFAGATTFFATSVRACFIIAEGITG